MHTYTMDDTLYSRLQKHAVPFVDTPADVISRALDALEKDGVAATPSSISVDSTEGHKVFRASPPPNLTHTTLLGMAIDKQPILKGVSWNNLMVEMIRAAGKQGVTPDEMLRLMEVPAEKGSHDHYSYTYVPEAGISVQGQNSNRAWKQAFRIATAIKMHIQASWVWQQKPEASQPGVKGVMAFDPE